MYTFPDPEKENQITNCLTKNYLVLDQGGHATRALIFSQAGEILFHCEEPISLLEKPGNIAEHDPDEMTHSFNTVLNKVQFYTQDNNLSLFSAGLATQRSSFVCINKITGRALSPIISWQDRRTFKDIIQYQFENNKIYSNTGLVLNPHYGASKMRWCLQNIKEVQIANKKQELMFAPLASFIMNQILKERPLIVDPGNASRTLLMNKISCTWDDEILQIFGIEKNNLPNIVTTNALFGHLKLKEKHIPLNLCTGDQNAMIFSQGAPLPEHIYVNVGTGAFVLNISDRNMIKPDSKLLHTVAYKDQHRTLYALEGTVNGAGRALQWLAKKHQIINYENNLEKWMKEFQNPPIFINGIAGVGSPYWLPNVESSFEFETAIEEKFVSVTESVLFLIYRNIEEISNLNKKISHIIISGGLANNITFCQLLADLSKVQVFRPEIIEATAHGIFNLLMQKQTCSISLDEQNNLYILPKSNPDIIKRYRLWKSKMETLIHLKTNI